MSENKLDVKSPYIKNEVNNFEEIRNRISKRAGSRIENNILSLSSSDKDVSDNLLEQKIQKIGKRIVGEEIRKFAEVASLEISDEFENIEKRLSQQVDEIGEDLLDKILLQSENISLIEGKLEEEINSKLGQLNSTLKEMEERIKDLEIFSLRDKKEILTQKSTQENKENNEEEIYTLNLSKNKTEASEIKDEIPNEEIIKCAEVCVEEINDNEILKCEEVCKVTIENDPKEKEYSENQLRKVASLFEKNGFLFKTNIFNTKIKDFIVEDFVKNKDEYKDINEADKEKICNILTDLMDTLTIDPEADETVENFIRRAYSKKFFLEN